MCLSLSLSYSPCLSLCLSLSLPFSVCKSPLASCRDSISRPYIIAFSVTLLNNVALPKPPTPLLLPPSPSPPCHHLLLPFFSFLWLALPELHSGILLLLWTLFLHAAHAPGGSPLADYLHRLEQSAERVGRGVRGGVRQGGRPARRIDL